MAQLKMTSPSHWFVATFISVAIAAPASAQGRVTLPVGQNLRDRPDEAGDVVLEIKGPGAYSLNGRPVAAPELVSQLSTLMRNTRDQIVYIRANANLPTSAIDSANAIVSRGGACVASFVGTQEPGTVSHVVGDAGQASGDVRRAIDVQLPLRQATRAAIARQEESAVVLEVLPGPVYRLNTQAVAAENLQQRLLEVYNPRPIKVLYVRGSPAASYTDLFRAMDAARYAGVVDIVAAPPELTIPSTLPRIDLAMRITERNDAAAARIDGNVGRCRRGDVYLGRLASATGAATEADHVYFEFQVETPVKQIANGVAPRYPDVMRTSRTNGDVLAQFVVDTSGRALPETLHILKSTDDLFSQAVRAALPEMRFVPATLGGKPVRQLVQMPFNFSVTP
jgi:TonB family protein